MCSIIISKEKIDELRECFENGQLEEFYKKNEPLIKDIDQELKAMTARTIGIEQASCGYVFSNFLIYIAYLICKQDDHLQNIPDDLQLVENNWEEFFKTHYNPFKLICEVAKEDGCVDFNFEYWQQFVTPKKEYSMFTTVTKMFPVAVAIVSKKSSDIIKYVSEYFKPTEKPSFGESMLQSARDWTESMPDYIQHVTKDISNIYNNCMDYLDYLEDERTKNGIFWTLRILFAFLLFTLIRILPKMLRISAKLVKWIFLTFLIQPCWRICEYGWNCITSYGGYYMNTKNFVALRTRKRREMENDIKESASGLNVEKVVLPQIDSRGSERDVKAYGEMIDEHLRESEVKSRAFDEKMKNERKELKKSVEESTKRYKESLDEWKRYQERSEQEKEDYHAEFEKKLKEQKDRFDEEMRRILKERMEKSEKNRKELEEMRKESMRAIQMFFACLQLKMRFEEKQQVWEDYLGLLRKPIICVELMVFDFRNTFEQYSKQYKNIDDISKKLYEMEYQQLYNHVIDVQWVMFEEFEHLDLLSTEHPDVFFLKVLKRSVSMVNHFAKDLITYLTLVKVDENDDRRGNMRSLEVELKKLSSRSIPTTRELIEMCDNDDRSLYDYIRPPVKPVSRKYDIVEIK